MARVPIVRARGPCAVDAARRFDGPRRFEAAVVGGVAVAGGLAGILARRPSVFAPADAALLFLSAAAVTAGLVCLAFALWGRDWVAAVQHAPGMVRGELRSLGDRAVVDGFVFEDLSGLCAVHDRDFDGRDAWRLSMLQTADGRPLHVGDFADEATMRDAARAVARIHPDLRVG